MRACASLLILVGSTLLATSTTVIDHGSPRIRAVALTFDAGADRGYAASILHTLERNHIRASFGMTGTWARQNRDLVRRMRRDGDQFINHTYDHRSFTGRSTGLGALSSSQRRWEIEQADRAIRAETGHSSKPYFRPPYGDYDAATVALLNRMGYRYMVMWTVDSLGWDHLGAAEIVKRCLRLTSPGTILLMHVGSQSEDAIALPDVMRQLRRTHYRFETVAQMVHSS